MLQSSPHITRYDTIRYDTIRYDVIRYDTIRCDTMWYDTIRYDTMRCDTIRYDAMRSPTANSNSFIYVPGTFITSVEVFWLDNRCKGDPQTALFLKSRFHAGHPLIWCVIFLERCICHGRGTETGFKSNNNLKISWRYSVYFASCMVLYALCNAPHITMQCRYTGKHNHM